jgi:hypothetical protein
MKKTFTLILTGLFSLSLYTQNHFPLVTDHYHLELSFDFKNETMQGNCKMTILNQSDTPVTQIPLLLYRLMKVNSVKDSDGENLNFTQSVISIEDFPKLQANHIVVDFEILPHKSIDIEMEYNGHLLGYAETGMKYITDRISPKFTIIRNDAYAYPVISKPSFAFLVNNIRNHLFTYDIHVTVPDTLTVASGGRLHSQTTHSQNLMKYHYISKKPTWRMDIAIASYNILNNDAINIFYLNNETQARKISEHGLNALQSYTRWWGDLQSHETLTIIETERNSGGQADELIILLPEESFATISDYHDLFHEIAHLWHVVIKEETGASPRWEEGLAEFSAYLLNQTMFTEKADLLKRAANANMRRLKADFNRNPSLSNTPLIDYGNQRITGLSYRQPMVMFSVLYYWLGDETFHRAIKDFYVQYNDNGASTRDFVNHWKQMAPSAPLEEFFNDWIFTTRFNEFISEGKELDDIVKHYSQL